MWVGLADQSSSLKSHALIRFDCILFLLEKFNESKRVERMALSSYAFSEVLMKHLLFD